MISNTEYLNDDVTTLFQKYYFTEVDLGLKELVAVQYSNDAIFLVEDEDYEKAIASLRKSYLLYPSEKTRDLLLFAVSNELTSRKYDSFDDIRLYVTLTRADSKTIKDDELLSEFMKVTSNVLFDGGATELYDQMYQHLSKEVYRKELLTEVTYVYYYERGRTLYNRGNHSEALPFLEEAYLTKPNNVDIETLFLACLGRVIEDDSFEDLIVRLEGLMKKHQNLKTNNNFGGSYLNAFLLAMGEKYKTNRFTDGKSYQTRFETLYSEHPRYKVDKDAIGMAYSQLAVYYFKKGQYANARKAINKGLEYVPNNLELKSRKRMMNY